MTANPQPCVKSFNCNIYDFTKKETNLKLRGTINIFTSETNSRNKKVTFRVTQTVLQISETTVKHLFFLYIFMISRTTSAQRYMFIVHCSIQTIDFNLQINKLTCYRSSLKSHPLTHTLP